MVLVVLVVVEAVVVVLVVVVEVQLRVVEFGVVVVVKVTLVVVDVVSQHGGSPFPHNKHDAWHWVPMMKQPNCCITWTQICRPS
jgi:hypothetical protein